MADRPSRLALRTERRIAEPQQKDAKNENKAGTVASASEIPLQPMATQEYKGTRCGSQRS